MFHTGVAQWQNQDLLDFTGTTRLGSAIGYPELDPRQPSCFHPGPRDKLDKSMKDTAESVAK